MYLLNILGLAATRVEPLAGTVVYSRGDEISVPIRCRHGGQACRYGASNAIVLHRRHLMVDLKRFEFALIINREFHV